MKSPTYNAERQRLDALAQANETRFARSRMKRNIKARRLRVQTVLSDPPWYAHTMTALELLMAMPRHGQARAHKRLQAAQITASRTVGELTERQRRVLIDVIEARA